MLGRQPQFRASYSGEGRVVSLPTIQPHPMRRSTRMRWRMPLRITSLERNSPFSEMCETVVVNAHGVGVRAPATPPIGARVQLETSDHRTTIGWVTDLEPLGPEATLWLVGIALEEPGNFWLITNPPEDWNNQWTKVAPPRDRGAQIQRLAGRIWSARDGCATGSRADASIHGGPATTRGRSRQRTCCGNG